MHQQTNSEDNNSQSTSNPHNSSTVHNPQNPLTASNPYNPSNTANTINSHTLQPTSTSRPASVLSQQASSGYGSTRSQCIPNSRLDAPNIITNTNNHSKEKKSDFKEKKDFTFTNQQNNPSIGEQTNNNNDEQNIATVHVERKTAFNPLLKTKLYFSLKLPGKVSFVPKLRSNLDTSKTRETIETKESDTSSSSISNSPISNMENESERLEGTSNENSERAPGIKQPISPSQNLPTLTVETTQTSRLIVRNEPSFPINKSISGISHNDHAQFNICANGNVSNFNNQNKHTFQYNPTHIQNIERNKTASAKNEMPCSPSADHQNSQNFSTEIAQHGMRIRPQSAMGQSNNFENSNFTKIATKYNYSNSSGGLQINNRNNRSKSTDNLSDAIPRPNPRIPNFNKEKPTYQNIPNAVQYWENVTLPNMTVADIRPPNNNQASIPKSFSNNGSTIVVSNVPLTPRNMTDFEVHIPLTF